MSLYIDDLITANEYNINTDAVDYFLTTQECKDIEKSSKLNALCWQIRKHFNEDSLRKPKKDLNIYVDFLETLERDDILNTLINKGYTAVINNDILKISC